MTIKEIYEKYKHFDHLLSDKQWLTFLKFLPPENSEDGSFVNQILFDLWQAIKEEAMKEISE